MRKRRREGKTDYKARLNLLKAEKPRIVIRKTNRYIIIQYVTSIEAKDKIVFGVNSKALLKYGWPGEKKDSLKSVSAAYLTGYLFGRKIKDRELEDGILDLGLARNVKKGRLYSTAKGILDSGVKINFKGETDDKKIKEKIKIEEIKQKIENETK